jgi:hypothetical protein
MLNAIALVAERRIAEAIAAGEFDNLPGAGRPLELEDLSHLPPDMRMAYTILKNSGCLGEEPSGDKPSTMRELLARAPEEGKVHARMRRLEVMLVRVRRAEARVFPERAAHGGPGFDDSPYLEKLLQRL